MLTGEYRNSLDEKGRLLIPARLRNDISGNSLVITRGVDACLWAFMPGQWTDIATRLSETTSLFQKKARILKRRIIAPAQEIEIDKAGRINIPPSLREYGSLGKEVVLLGLEDYIEIWDEELYRRDMDENEAEFLSAAEELGKILSL